MARAAAVKKEKAIPGAVNGREWPASSVELWPLEKIKPYPKNARTHPEHQIALLASLMKERGVTAPILVDEDGVIIKGHGRRMAAERVGIRDYPVNVARGWTDEEKRAERISDNQLGLISGWNYDLLHTEVSELKIENYDVSLLGFDDASLSWMQQSGNVVLDPLDEFNQSMPEFRMEDKTAFRSIVVHFKDQESVDEFAEILSRKISEKDRFLWYPEIEIEHYAEKQWVGK